MFIVLLLLLILWSCTYPLLLPRPWTGDKPLTASQPPPWVKDEDVLDCMSCGRVFTLTVRKHHCRCCGRIVCWKCRYASLCPCGYAKYISRIDTIVEQSTWMYTPTMCAYTCSCYSTLLLCLCRCTQWEPISDSVVSNWRSGSSVWWMLCATCTHVILSKTHSTTAQELKFTEGNHQSCTILSPFPSLLDNVWYQW